MGSTPISADPAALDAALEWTRPGAYEVADGVYRIPLVMPNDGLAAVNVYAIEDGKGLTLIDGGWAVEAARRDLELALKSLGCTPKSLTRILVTHSHRDHYTLAVQLRRDFGVPIALGIGERRAIEGVIAGKKNFTTQVEILREAGADELATQIESHDRIMDVADGWELPDQWLEEGVVDIGTRELTVMSTPGHTQGHVVFSDLANGLMLAGDHVLPRITPSIGLESNPGSSPLRDFLASLEKVRALPDLKLFAAHGPVGPSTHARVAELIAHHDERLNEMEAIVVNGAREVTGFHVASSVGWTRRKRTLDELTTFNRMLAVTETVAHLRVLVANHRILSRRDAGSGVVFYTRPRPTLVSAE